MPAFFTSLTPMKLVDFDYEAFFTHIEETVGGLSFFSKWKKFWINFFQEQDQQILDFIKEHPGSNPIMERLKRPNVPSRFNYESFVYEYITPGGSFYLHFDVEKIKVVQHQYLHKVTIPIEDIPIGNIYIDPTTPIVENKLTDQRLPYLTKIYGSDKPFICVDGNHRIQSKIKNSEVQNIKAYIFSDDHWDFMFFLKCDVYFMALTKELQSMAFLLNQKGTEQDILEVTQMYLQQASNS
ncbi:hypothetical protein NDK43_26140 [Neobacillus pocheonensis]|uniref:Uncharacterized protein n=1 Tax=Neobacillus pocheonensis TaxID=363869 RepID=A0ABT0WI72_9BACI|nr:hypothetical protein [Neobacillus pocheonensis]